MASSNKQLPSSKASANTAGKKKLNAATAKANEDISKEYRPRKEGVGKKKM